MSSNGTSNNTDPSSDGGLASGVLWTIIFFSTMAVFSAIMLFVCCDGMKKYKRRKPFLVTGEGYPRQPPPPPPSGPALGTESTESSNQVKSSQDATEIPTASRKKSALPPLSDTISTISGNPGIQEGIVNAGFSDKPLPSINERSSEIVLTPVQNFGVSIYS